MSCPICYDEEVALKRLECGHSCCEECLKRWFETEETTGQLSATCPLDTCRQSVSTTAILGRAFIPAGSNHHNKKKRARTTQQPVDASTQQWLDDNTLECGGCQTPLVKASGCDKLQCLCGWRVCWNCRTVGARCQCNPGHGFIDNVTGRPSWGKSQQATPDDLNNFKGYLEEQQKKDPLASLFSAANLDFAFSSAERRKRRRRFEDQILNHRNPFSFSPAWQSPLVDSAASTPMARTSTSLPLSSSYSFTRHSTTRRRDFCTDPRASFGAFAAAPTPPTYTNHTTTTSSGSHPPFASLMSATAIASDQQQEDDFSKAIRLSLESMKDFDRDLAKAIQNSMRSRTIMRSNANTNSAVGKTANNPLWIVDDDDDNGKPAAVLDVSGKTASDPVCLDSDEDKAVGIATNPKKPAPRTLSDDEVGVS